ncbi:MAG: tRNA (adenosine(37)-N6)-threonylcarbamoyltransferase complex dimerization subunit type 1 TsaB [Parvularculaceae bacterium]
MTLLVLALDTALKSCSLAILDRGPEGARVLADIHERLEKGHAERIAPMAMDALAKASLGVKDIDRVGVVIGPGAFAGVRVGVAFARGLALGTKLDVVGVTSLAALAGALPKKSD